MAVWQKLATILASDLLRLFSSQTMASDRFQEASFFRRPDNLTRTLRQAKVTTTAHERTSLQSSRFFRGYKLLRIPRVVPSQDPSLIRYLALPCFLWLRSSFWKIMSPSRSPLKLQIVKCSQFLCTSTVQVFYIKNCFHLSYFKVSFFTAALFQFIAVIFPQKKVMKKRTFSLSL